MATVVLSFSGGTSANEGTPPGAGGSVSGLITANAATFGANDASVTFDLIVTGNNATNGTDYFFTPAQSVTLAPGGTFPFTIPFVEDFANEPNETISVQIQNLVVNPINSALPVTVGLISNGSQIVTITNDDPVANQGTVQIVSVTPNPVGEGGGTVTVQVQYTEPVGGSTFGLQSITLSTVTSAGAASSGTGLANNADVQPPVISTYTFGVNPGADGNFGLQTDQLLSFTIPVNDDSIVEEAETFNVDISAVNGAFELAPAVSPVVTINDNDGPGNPSPGRGTIQIEFNGYSVTEGQGFVDLRILRVGGTSGTISAVIDSRSGSATENTDFTSVDQTSIVFGDGDASPKTIRVPIIADGNSNELNPETFSVDLIELRGSESLVVDTAVVDIFDSDSNSEFGTLNLTPTVVNVNENAGVVTIFLTYTGGSVPTSINYTVELSEGTAIAGKDYIENEFTLENIPGTDAFTIPLDIAIINDTDVEITESFNVRISESKGAFLGTTSVVVNILDDDGPNGAPQAPIDNPTYNPITPFPTIATDGNDNIYGSEGNDSLFGNKGNDTLFGLVGNDTIYGGQNEDSLFGNQGVDFLLGNKGNDTLSAGKGDDVLYGGQDNDILRGDVGNDFLSGDLGIDTLIGGEGSDRFALRRGGGYDYVADYELGIDSIGLVGGLQYGDIYVIDSANGAIIKAVAGNEDLMIVGGVSAGQLGAENFIVVS